LAKPSPWYHGWLIGLLVLLILGAGLWFARPYLPAWSEIAWPDSSWFEQEQEAPAPAPEASPRVAEIALPPPSAPAALPPRPVEAAPPTQSLPEPANGAEIQIALPPPSAPLPPRPVEAAPPAQFLPEPASGTEIKLALPPPSPPPPLAIPAEPESAAPAEAPPAAPAEPAPLAEASTPAGEKEKLLAQAEEQLAARRLTSPAGNNAYETYQALARLDSAQASKLLERIVENYLRLARERLAQSPQAAVEIQRKIQELAPQDPAHEVLFGEILEHLSGQARQQAEAGQGDAAHQSYQELARLAPQAPQTQAAREAAVRGLLRQAESQLQARQYTTPAKSNAYDSLQGVLRLDPGNASAQAGLQRIAESYLELARSRLNRGQTRNSLDLIERGLAVVPQHAGLLDLRKQAQAPAPSPTPAPVQETPAAAPPPAPAPVQETPAAAPLQDMLQRAAQQLARDQLSQPAGDNAYETYREILRLAPENSQAREGLLRIAGRYQALAQAQMEQGRYQQSLMLIGEGLAIVPSHQELLKLKHRVLEAMPQ
jgi:tetratricopeptide (TPR) repeat protein